MPEQSPHVSVIMTVYNGERYLREAVDSLLRQTFTDFELIIVNDGSTDGTSGILDTYDDPRIVRLDNPENLGRTLGLAYAPNRALAKARGKYIARQDADDISLPNRLERQLAYLERHPDTGLVGSWVQLIDIHGKVIGQASPPTDPILLKWALAFQNHFTQSSVMFPRRVLNEVGPYAKEMQHAEDYELWWRISNCFPVANLPEYLVKRRITPGGVVNTYPELQREYSVRVMHKALSHRLGEEVPFELASAMDRLMRNMSFPHTASPLQLARLIRRCYFSYVGSESMSRIERQRVAQDAAEKLFILGGKALARSALDALVIAGWAERISIRLPALVTVRSLLGWKLSGKSDSTENP